MKRYGIPIDRGWDRPCTTRVWFDLHRCECCGATRKCLVADCSDGEYTPAAICRQCFEDHWTQAGCCL